MFTGKSTGKGPLRRSRSIFEDNVRVDLKVIIVSAGDWVDSVQDRDFWGAFVNVALNLRVS